MRTRHKRFNICEMLVEKSSYIAFLIHKDQFAFHVHELKITIKLGFGELWADAWVTLVFARLRHNAYS